MACPSGGRGEVYFSAWNSHSERIAGIACNTIRLNLGKAQEIHLHRHYPAFPG